MIRKGITYLFLILANLILVGHGIIPHHHHDKQVCFDSVHCEHDGMDNKDPGPVHHHDDEHDGHSCFLSEFIPIPVNFHGIITFSPESKLLFWESYSFNTACNLDLKTPERIIKISYSSGPPNQYVFDFQINSALRAPPLV